MTQIKICGITRRTDALTAAACGADALGFIFYEASPRHVTPETARMICCDLPKRVVRVGVFVNEDASRIMEIVDFCGLDMIQLHGDEPPEYCRRFPAELLIKAVSFQGEGDPAALADYPVRAILLDQREAGRFGGTGKPSDWNWAGCITALYPLILAGGLHAGNIEAAIRIAAPDAVDINSGVEHAPGKKDPEKVSRIMEIIRSIDHDKTVTRPQRPFRRLRGPLCRRDADARPD
ncbi:MAG: phosphoribosylanthranilate isomerase [Syntrophus sp. (in: bacteria)]|nr:phosphoribosylanthranilate isomerase [Syntrophus sp. (in: bacteria)]